jgi:hypothetical protein
MRTLSYYNDNNGVDDAGPLIFMFVFAIVISINCCIFCPGEGLLLLGGVNMFLSVIMMATGLLVGGTAVAGILGGIIWMAVGQSKIINRSRIQREQEVAERIPSEDDSPIAIDVRRDNSCPPRNMTLQRKIQQGSGNYQKIIPARIVFVRSLEQSSNRVEKLVNYGPRSSSTDSPVKIATICHHDNTTSCPPRNTRKTRQGGNYHEIIREELQYKKSCKIAALRDVGLEQSSNRVKESVTYGTRSSSADVAEESVEMTTIRAGQLKQEQHQQGVGMLAEQQGMSSFLDKEKNREQDENEIV